MYDAPHHVSTSEEQNILNVGATACLGASCATTVFLRFYCRRDRVSAQEVSWRLFYNFAGTFYRSADLLPVEGTA